MPSEEKNKQNILIDKSSKSENFNELKWEQPINNKEENK